MNIQRCLLCLLFVFCLSLTTATKNVNATSTIEAGAKVKNLFSRNYNQRRPSSRPTKRKENRPARERTKKPTPPTTFRRGDLTVNVPALGIRLSTGMSVRLLARANKKVRYANGKYSRIPFHSMPDGAATFPLSNGRYVYVSNSEMKDGNGGVYAVYFSRNGEIVDYRRLLSGTTRNCSGGKTPWNTWISCEEYGKGQCWQVDPDPGGAHFLKPERTRLGQDGGSFEAVACDDRDLSKPVFYLTEDAETGALRRYRPQQNSGWNTLHDAGGVAIFDYLFFLDENRFTWTTDLVAARNSQKKYYKNVEGIDFLDGKLHFISKKTYLLYTLDLENLTYTTTSTDINLVGDGSFTNSPDQIIPGRGGAFSYFTEDGGRSVGVYAIDTNNERYSIFEAYSEKYYGDETTGLAFSPDGKKMYACFQDCGCEDSDNVDFNCGCLLEFSRTDGKSFDGTSLSLKFYSGT